MSEYWQRLEDSDTFSISWRELKVPLHAGLFLITFFTTTLAGVDWIGKDPLNLLNFGYGLTYSVSLRK